MTPLPEHWVEATNYSLSVSFKNRSISFSVHQKINYPPKVIGKDLMAQSWCRSQSLVYIGNYKNLGESNYPKNLGESNYPKFDQIYMIK